MNTTRDWRARSKQTSKATRVNKYQGPINTANMQHRSMQGALTAHLNYAKYLTGTHVYTAAARSVLLWITRDLVPWLL